MKFNITIKEVSPLLMHKFSPSDLTVTKKRTGDKNLTDKEKREVATHYLYTHKGKVVQPSIHLEQSFQKAAVEFRMAGAGKKTFKELAKAAVFIFPEYLVHKNQKWITDERAVVNPSTRGRSMCYRPRLDKWELDFDLEVNDDRIDADTVKSILEYAGLYKGIGSYRPRFGRFEIKKFREV